MVGQSECIMTDNSVWLLGYVVAWKWTESVRIPLGDLNKTG